MVGLILGNRKNIMKKGFTLVELAVVLAIIVILVLLLIPAVQQARKAGQQAGQSNVFLAKVIRKYEYVYNGNTQYRIDIQKGDKSIEVLKNEWNFSKGHQDTAVLQATLIEGKWYQFEVDQHTLDFRNISKITEVPDPEQPSKAEIEFP